MSKLKAKRTTFRDFKIALLIAGAIVAIVILTTFGLGNRFYNIHKNDPLSLGVSFSVPYAQQLGLNWQQAYTAILDELQVKRIRLMTYWDKLEPTPGQFDFTKLDWQIQEAAKRGAKVNLVVGIHQPRWPECYVPTWADDMQRSSGQSQLLNYIRAVVERYKDAPNLEGWQLENEVRNHFGICPPYNHDLLISEHQLLKELDPQHPLTMSLSDETGLPLGEPVPDGYGFSIYRIVYNEIIYHGYQIYPATMWQHRLRAYLIDGLRHKPLFIHELQMEPWGPALNAYISQQEQDKSMNPNQMQQNFNYALQTGIRKIDLWGAEWWYWRKVHFNDPGPWQTAQHIIQQSH